MSRLMQFELKKHFSSVKNLFVWGLMLLAILIFVLSNVKTDLIIRGYRYAWDSSSWDASIQLNQLLQTYPKEIPEDAQKAMDLWRRDATYAAQQRVFMNWVGEDRWKDVVLANIKRSENVLNGIREGYINIQSEEEGGVDEEDLVNTINLNQILYDRDIKPLRYAPGSKPLISFQMNGINFIIRTLSDLMPFLTAVVVLLLCSDSISSEMDSGSFKFLLLQPHARGKVLAAKLLSNLIYVFTVFLGSLLAFFIVLSAINGVGSLQYPIAYDPHAYSSFAVSAKSDVFEYMGAGAFILQNTLLFAAYLTFLTSFAAFVSVLSQESLNAMTTSISIVFAAGILQSLIRKLSLVSLIWPFSYSNVVQVLSGSSLGSALAGYLVFGSCSTVLFLLSYLNFRKKDILC